MKNKGISLIVLVITIVVIIILASAVILNVTKNNPMDSAKIAKLMQEKENLDSSMQMYLAKVMSNTLGEYSTKEIITGEAAGYNSLLKGNELSSDTLVLREADSVRIKEELDITLPKTGNNEKIKWYINIPTGTFYLIHDSAKDYANYLGKYDSETEVLENVSLARFVMTKKSMQVKEENDTNPDESSSGKANAPVLMKGMTGVYFDSNGNEIVVTDENKESWYNYEANIWANAKTKDGSYWVWIPRYEYKITYFTDETKTVESQDVTKYGKIDVKFIPTSQVAPDEGYTYIHPAFRDGSKTNYINGEWDKEISGFWVAKYSAGFQANTTNESDATVLVNGNDEIVYSDKNYTSYDSTYNINALSQNLIELPKMSYPVFKSLTYSYNNISIGDSYTLAQEVSKASNFYGLNSNNTDSHMMKNSEWGAVIYLTHSKYGRNGIDVSMNSKSLNNLSSKYIYAVTGYENETPNGGGASSTGNKSGIFDLSGCVWERVAGYISNGDENIEKYGKSCSTNEVYESNYFTLNTKYITVYPYDKLNDNNIENWEKYKSLKSSTYGYGDAILETSVLGDNTNSWNNDFSRFLYSKYPFFIRGAHCFDSKTFGIFAFNSSMGEPKYDSGFRVVLIQN